MTETSTQRPRRAVKLSEQVAQEIVSEIARSGMTAGTRLPSEVVMAQSRGVSRAVVREALRILEVHGLITIRTGPGGGPELAELTPKDFARMSTLHFQATGVSFRQLLEARQVLEPSIAELAALNRTPEQVLELRANVRKQEQAHDVDELMRHADAFHTLVSTMAGPKYKVLSLMTLSLHGIFDLYARQGRTVEAMGETAQIHRQISDAIEQSDPQLASELMATHMRASEETFAREHPTLIDGTVSWLSV